MMHFTHPRALPATKRVSACKGVQKRTTSLACRTSSLHADARERAGRRTLRV